MFYVNYRSRVLQHPIFLLRLCSLPKIDLREREMIGLSEFESEWCVVFLKRFKGDYE